MLGKNNVQKNFKKEMKSVEKQLLEREKNKPEEPSNTFFKEKFYGQSDKSVKTKFKNFFNFLLSYGFIIIVAFFVIYSIFISSSNYESKAHSAFEDQDYESTVQYCKSALESTPKNYDLLMYKGISHRILENYQEAIEVFQIADEHYPDNVYILNELGYCNYYSGYYYKSLEYYDQVLEIDFKNAEALFWKGFVSLDLYECDEAIKYADKLLDLGYNNTETHNLKGLAFLYQDRYAPAIKHFNKAIKSSYEDYEVYEEAHLNKIFALFSQNDLLGCIEFCQSIQKKFPNNSDIPYYIGDCYSFMGEYQKAIKYYKETIEIDPENHWAIADIAWQLFYLQDYPAAKSYAQKAIDIGSENYMAQELLNELEKVNLPEAERIVNFVEENYLYLDKIEDFGTKAESFISKDEVEYEDIYEFIESIRLEDDLFTFFVWGDYYEQYMEEIEDDEIEYIELDENYHYLRFNSFTPKISSKFIHTMKNIPSTEDSYLILDLRNNPGGLLFTATNILDSLMPRFISSYSIDRDGYMHSFQTTDDHFEFKHIYILVNEESASASEVVSLSLKTYLPNVTIVGRGTYGKGVGQVVFENKDDKYIIFLVDSFWNVKETNILGKSVQPDVVISGTELEHFLDSVMID
ncbi:S41 family peptidase [Herbivorax sp. ANBcel31]|uniref:S41 family peptidase n=1 Tax=Herbivorax sp. ANBcel31 TaxID=3069754 RepID=UPI0027B0AEF2|nr:S41 family peptidase [Herbivorax sp. ANBcel31]MDQ2086704.1 S41 family peptidase [Herbivorax sp. ANBcel31]